MKKLSLILPVILLGLSVPLQTRIANAQNWKMLEMWDTSTIRPVSLRLENAQTSEQLIAFSKASGFNVFADATHFSPASSPVSLDAEKLIRDWILETASQEHLSWRRSRERTLLFWKEPDVVSVAKALVAETQNQRPKETEAATPQKTRDRPVNLMRDRIIAAKEIELLLANYLQEQQGWDGKSPVKLEFNLSELPPQTATKVRGFAVSSLKQSKQDQQKSWLQDAAWLSDQHWQTARLLYAKPPGQPDPLLAVYITDGKAQLFMPLENLSVLPLPAAQKPEAAEAVALAEKKPALEIDLSGEAVLSSPISLEVKEIGLSDLLSELQKQSGATFEISPDVNAARRLTARVSSVPIREIMEAISELYGIGWAKTEGGAYLMQSKLSPTLARALQVGDTSWYSYWRSPSREKSAPERLTLYYPLDWQGKLMEAGFNGTEMQGPEGMAFSDLPTELQTLARTAIEQHYAVDLMRQYYEAFDSSASIPESNEEITLSVSPAPQLPIVAGRKRPLIDNSPLLKVALMNGTTEFFTYGISGPQMRQMLAESMRAENERRARMNPQ